MMVVLRMGRSPLRFEWLGRHGLILGGILQFPTRD